MEDPLKENTWNFLSKPKTFVGSIEIYSKQNIGDLKRILKSVQEKEVWLSDSVKETTRRCHHAKS